MRLYYWAKIFCRIAGDQILGKPQTSQDTILNNQLKKIREILPHNDGMFSLNKDYKSNSTQQRLITKICDWAKMFKWAQIKKYMSDQSVILPK